MNVDEYLDRIAYNGSREPTLATLRALHTAHLLSVPFENLDIHLSRKIIPREDLLYDKIVRRRRGGFCYELNGVFASLLGALGYRVTMLSAGVAREAGGFGPEFDHLALRVDLDQPWLADVGFGESFDPVRFDGNNSGEYKIVPEGEAFVLYRDQAPRYRFTLQPRVLDDFTGMCDYHQTSPLSSFTRSRLISQATPGGRVTLTNTRLILTRGEERNELPVQGDVEFGAFCGRYFGISWPLA